jgi:hypothetical protein
MVTGCMMAVTPTPVILFIVNYNFNFPDMSLYALQRKSHLCISFLGITGPQS